MGILWFKLSLNSGSLRRGESDAQDDLSPAAAGLETVCNVPHKDHGIQSPLSLKSSEVDVSCGLIPLVYSEPAGLQCASLLGQVVSCLLQRVRVSITMLTFHQWQGSQINLQNSVKQDSLLDTYSFAD